MTKVKLNNAGFRAVRQSAGVQAALNREANAMAARANSMAQVPGAHYEAAPAISTDRGSIALVSTGHGSRQAVKAMEDNALNGTLSKAVG